MNDTRFSVMAVILIALLIGLGGVQSTIAQTTVKTVGASGADYANLNLAFAAINNRTLTGDIELQLISSVTHNSTANLYGAGEVSEVVVAFGVGSGYTQSDIVTFSAPETPGGVTATGRISSMFPATTIAAIEITNPGSGYINPPTITITTVNGTGANISARIGGSYSSVSIYPTVSGVVLQGAVQDAIINLKSADNVAIDGRVNRAGSEPDMKIQNTNTGTFSPTIVIGNKAENININHTKIYGRISDRISIETSSNGLGNSDITIVDNYISTITGTTLNTSSNLIGVSIKGNSTNSNITIKDNEFVDMLSTGSVGILLNDSPNTVTIEGNHFYQPTEVTGLANSPRAIMRLYSGSNIVIKNNYMGGTEKFTGGEPWKHSGTGNYYGILIVDNSAMSSLSIQGNTFANFNITSTSSPSSWNFGFIRTSNIPITNFKIGDEISNVVGSLDDSQSIVCSCNVFGINVLTGGALIKNNTIAGLEADVSLYGILTTTNIVEISGNIVANLTLNSTATTNAFAGIQSGSLGTANIISNNYIYNLTNLSEFNTLGINVNVGTVANNIIKLSASSTSSVVGINKINAGSVLFYHNTVLIDGSVSTGSKNSYALFDNRSDTRNYRNNIFTNLASNSGDATGKHYAISLASAPGTIDYNNYFVSGLGGVLGSFNNSDKTTIADWKAATTKDCFSSGVNPLFTGGKGDDAGNLLPTNAALLATPITGFTKDYFDVERSSTVPSMGAIEYAITEPSAGFSIKSLTPTSGIADQTITIKGISFTGATAVKFNNVDATSYTVVNDSTITAVTPATVSTGKISVVKSCGTVVSTSDFVVVVPQAPDAPTNLVVSEWDRQITISFTEGADGGSPITNYEFQIDGGEWIPFDPSVTSSPVTIFGLTNGTEYTIKLRAKNALGSSPESASVTATPVALDLTTLGCITVVESGGATEGTTWTYTNNTILPNSATNVDLNASDLVAKMALSNLTVAAKCITVSADVNYSTDASSLTLKASGNVILSVGNQITTNGGDVVFWADADDNRLGGIRVGDDFAGIVTTSITSNGGDIILSGGVDPLTGYAHYDAALGSANSLYYFGVGVFGATIDARGSGIEGGDIIVRGNGGNTFNGLLWVVNIGGQYGANTTLVTDGSGKINVDGDASESPPNSTPTNSRNSWAVSMPGTIETETGAIHLIGKANVARTNARGFSISGSVQSLSGAITIEDITTGTDNVNYNGPFVNGLKVGKGSLSSSSSNVSLIADKFAFEGSIPISTSGNVVLESNGVSFIGDVTIAGVNTESASLRIGKATNTKNITLSSNQNIQGPITIHGANLAINGTLTATGGDINLHATGAVTQTAAITADGLGLHGTGTFTLTNISNNVKTIAGGNSTTKLGSLSFVDASDGLEIGSVNPDGIVATGKIKVETLTGDLTISNDVTTDDTTSDAIILNAGKSSAIGTATGGDIKISGTPKITMGSGSDGGDGGQGGSAGKITVATGTAKLFSGSAATSTGLSDFVGEENTRFYVDETTSLFTPPLSSGAYALYRELGITEPEAPTGLTATPGDGQIEIAFTAGDDGGSEITNYQYSLDDGKTWISFDPAVTSSPVTITGLDNGTDYTVQIRAVNEAGEGTASDDVTATPRTVPQAPAITLIEPDDRSASVAFSVPADDGGNAITNYEYTIDGTNWIALNPASESSPFTIPGLTNGTEYAVKLRAVNDAGSGAASDEVKVTPRTVPTAPTGLTATPSDGQIEIAFTPGNDGGDAVTNYQYSLDGGQTWITLNPADATSPITISGLDNGTEYTVQIRAVNAAGAGAASDEVDVTPRTVPSAPAITTVTPGDGTAVVAFTPPFDNGGNAITNYEYTIDGINWIALSPASTSSPFTISGLTNGTEYTVQLRAVNDAGSGAASNEVNVKPLTVASAPSNLVATAGDGQIEIAFTAPSNDGGSPVTNYQYSLDGGQTWLTLDPADASSPVTIPGLTNGTEYTVQLRAVNEAGPGAASGEVTATPVTVPSAPTNLVATVGDGQLTVEFTAGSDGGSPVTNYEYSLDGGATWIAFDPAVTTSPVTITNLENNTEYTVILRARNEVGAGSPSAGVTAKLNDYSDADGDGVPQFQEVIDGTDPDDGLDYKDSDGDGVPDYVEAADGTDPADASDFTDSDGGGTPDYVESVLWPNSGLNPGNILDSGDDSRDTDGDGVPDYREFLDGTDPKDPADYRDSDGDEVPDYVESLDGTDPANPANYRDTDNDGVPNYVEQRDGTDPNDGENFVDPDGDRVPSYIEKREGTDPKDALSYLDGDGDLVPNHVEKRDGTDPADSYSFNDSDKGGTPDYVETVYYPSAGLPSSDPGQKADDARDSDGDGVSDYREFLDGTDPLDALSFLDDDKDGVPNQVEERDGTDPSDPLSYLDTDGDGVPDYVETRDGTDPRSPFSYKDTDGDLVPDFVEARDGTDPADASKFKDTDKGGTPDYVESVLFATYGLPKGNTADSGDDARDTDADGVNDYAELRAGTDPLNGNDYGFTRGTGSCLAPYDPFIVDTVYHLNAVRQQPDKCYLQVRDIDARLTKQWNQGRGFTPIGSNGPAFSGSYDGDGFLIEGLYINELVTGGNQPDDAPGAALFGKVLGSPERNVPITDVRLDSVQVTGRNNVGALVGYGQWVTLSGVSSSGSVVGGGERAGGLVGHGRHVTIERSYSGATLTGTAQWKGGLAGALRDSRVTDSYFAGVMGASARSAGMVAYLERSALSNTYSAMRVIAGDAPSANAMVGMVADAESSTAENSYWDVTVSGVSTSSLGQLGTTVQMMDQGRFASWDFTQTWAIASGDSVSYPYLKANQPRHLPGHRAASYVQVIHNMSGGSVRVEIDEVTRVGSLSQQGSTPYMGIPSGAAFQIRLVSTSSGKVLVNYGNAPLGPGESRLIYAIGGDDEQNAQIITYAQTKRESASAGLVDVVFVHGASPYTELDLDYVSNTAPVSVIRNIATGVSSGSKSDYTSLNYTPVKTFRLSSDGQTIGVFNFALEGLNGQAFKIVALSGGVAKQANGISLVAVTADGRVIGAQLGTSLDEAQVPQGFALHGNYPNPFNPSTSIRFDLPETAEVTIQVVDVLGRMVMNHRAGAIGSGANRTVNLDASRLASGVYLYRIVAAGVGQTHTATGRFTLIK